jgi:hypothetical protein
MHDWGAWRVMIVMMLCGDMRALFLPSNRIRLKHN